MTSRAIKINNIRLQKLYTKMRIINYVKPRKSPSLIKSTLHFSIKLQIVVCFTAISCLQQRHHHDCVAHKKDLFLKAASRLTYLFTRLREKKSVPKKKLQGQ